ncbi:MAG: hypothetical protein ABIK25_07165 [Pseudomonadota bacterium]
MRENDMRGMTTSVFGWNAIKQTLADFGGMLLSKFLPALIVSLLLMSAVFNLATTEDARQKTCTAAQLVVFSIVPSSSYASTVTYKDKVYRTSDMKGARLTPKIAYTSVIFMLCGLISLWLPMLFTIVSAKLISVISNELRRDKHIQGVGDVLDIETGGVEEFNIRMRRLLRGKKRVPGKFLTFCARHIR